MFHPALECEELGPRMLSRVLPNPIHNSGRDYLIFVKRQVHEPQTRTHVLYVAFGRSQTQIYG